MTDWAGFWIGLGIAFGLDMLGGSIRSGMRSLADAIRTNDEDGDDA